MSIYNKGDIVYWCENEGHGKFSVKWGIVDEEFSDRVMIDYLSPFENRRVNGVPILEFKDDKYHKLPKGWTYNTLLYELTFDERPEEMKNLFITNPEDIKLAFEKGWLVKDKDVFHGEVQTEITKEGYRVYTTYPMFHHHMSYVGVQRHRLHKTYDEAKAEMDAEIAELNRQASLSDKDWSIEQIEKAIGKYLYMFWIPPESEQAQKVREYMMSLKNIEDVEVRVSSEGLQWKYWKNKRWISVVV